MNIIKVKDNPEAGIVASKKIAEMIKNNPNIVLGLATGSTPITTNVKAFNLDEYKGIDGNHDQSYKFFMKETLFDHVNINKNNCHIPSGHTNNNEEAAKYDEEIKKAGGIDLQLLGLGVNGHVGFNEPGASFDSITSIVDLTESTIEVNSRFFENKKDVPTQAISMGLKTIANAKEILLIATGKNKAEAVKHLVNGPVTTE
ncbi:hypothetical protein FQR65_LT16461 [Abscondita terminalis]|nr:hypothetical protein FQR65_LT16461 [Abscondita terminalis]